MARSSTTLVSTSAILSKHIHNQVQVIFTMADNVLRSARKAKKSATLLLPMADPLNSRIAGHKLAVTRISEERLAVVMGSQKLLLSISAL
jgi:hypothetical protein